MRAISDRKLPDPYRSWIDRSAPLPPGVRLLARTVDVGTDLTAFLTLGPMMGVMGALFVLLPPWRFDPATEGWQPYLIVAALCLGLWSVPVLLLRRLLITWGAQKDLKRGTLRQGVLLGPEGMLLRMEPGRCHPIPRDRFVAARRFPPEGTTDRRKPTVIIETLDGSAQFFADRLGAPAAAINTGAKELWRGWSKPKRQRRADRRKLKDVHTPRRMQRAAYLFGGSGLTVFAATFGVTLVREGSTTADVIALVLFLALIVVAGSTVYMIVWFLRFKLSYRCPECRGRTERVPDAMPANHFHCAACNVEWDTGVSDHPD